MHYPFKACVQHGRSMAYIFLISEEFNVLLSALSWSIYNNVKNEGWLSTLVCVLAWQPCVILLSVRKTLYHTNIVTCNDGGGGDREGVAEPDIIYHIKGMKCGMCLHLVFQKCSEFYMTDQSQFFSINNSECRLTI